MANTLISLINCKIRLAAESLGLPFLSAYLSSVGSNFTTGANFATSGSTIQHPIVTWFQSGYSPFSLDIQAWQFNLFKSRSKKFHDQGSIHQFYIFLDSNVSDCGFFVHVKAECSKSCCHLRRSSHKLSTPLTLARMTLPWACSTIRVLMRSRPPYQTYLTPSPMLSRLVS